MGWRWDDLPGDADGRRIRAEDVAWAAVLAVVFVGILGLMFWRSFTMDDHLDEVPTTFPEERYESDYPGS